MAEVRGAFEAWLDGAMESYTDVAPPLGFESRMVAALRERQARKTWKLAWALGSAAVALVVAAIVLWPASTTSIPAALHSRILVPVVERSVSQAAVHRSQPPRVLEVSVRGVPIVEAPLSSQEQAMIRFTRTMRAKQLAGLVVHEQDLSREARRAQIEDLAIPPIWKEDEK